MSLTKLQLRTLALLKNSELRYIGCGYWVPPHGESAPGTSGNRFSPEFCAWLNERRSGEDYATTPCIHALAVLGLVHCADGVVRITDEGRMASAGAWRGPALDATEPNGDPHAPRPITVEALCEAITRATTRLDGPAREALVALREELER